MRKTLERKMSAGRGVVTPVLQVGGVKREREDEVRRVSWWTAGTQGASARVRARTAFKELCLRGRLAAKGFGRGLCGSGVIGVARVHAVKIRCTCGNPRVIHPGAVCPMGVEENHGLVSTKLITDAGVAFLVDDWDNNAADLTTLNFHGCGTGVAAENATDTALGTESTTALNPDSTRATGTRSQPAANQYRSVGTATFDATAAITEHGIFSQAATGGGTLWDRSVFTAINVASGDSIQFTYTATLSAGG
jgi:hypothetical protein